MSKTFDVRERESAVLHVECIQLKAFPSMAGLQCFHIIPLFGLDYSHSQQSVIIILQSGVLCPFLHSLKDLGLRQQIVALNTNMEML